MGALPEGLPLQAAPLRIPGLRQLRHALPLLPRLCHWRAAAAARISHVKLFQAKFQATTSHILHESKYWTPIHYVESVFVHNKLISHCANIDKIKDTNDLQ